MTSEITSRQRLDDLLNRHFAGQGRPQRPHQAGEGRGERPGLRAGISAGPHCASNDEAIIEDGLKTVKKILAENYVRPDEAEKVKSIIRERGASRSSTR